MVREGRKHIVMPDGIHFITIPGNNPINAYTMAGIVKDSGLTVEEFKIPWVIILTLVIMLPNVESPDPGKSPYRNRRR